MPCAGDIHRQGDRLIGYKSRASVKDAVTIAYEFLRAARRKQVGGHTHAIPYDAGQAALFVSNLASQLRVGTSWTPSAFPIELASC